MSFPKYSDYSDSDLPWLEKLPSHWEIKPFFAHFEERKQSNLGMKENNLLSLSYGRIVGKDINTLDGLLPESFETYQVVYPGDLVFRLTDLQNDKRSLRSALVGQKGIITAAYLAAVPRGISSRYAHYLFRCYDLEKVFYSMGGGLRQGMKYADMRRLGVLVPSKFEQENIAAFLDHETAKIDALIAEQQRLIELLKEKRQAVISHAVTKGLNPNAPMKDSGVEWLGEVPAHWRCMSYRYATRIIRGKFGHRPRNDPALYDGDFPFIQTGDVARTSKYITEYKQTLNDRGASVSAAFPAGTLVMAIAANIGDTAILQFDAYAPDSVVGFKPSFGINLEYLRYSLDSSIQALEQTSTQSTQANLNIDRVGGVKAAFPPEREQVEIVKYLDNICDQFSGLMSDMESSIGLMMERRSALISAAVTGKIDVRDWRADPECSVPVSMAAEESSKYG